MSSFPLQWPRKIWTHTPSCDRDHCPFSFLSTNVCVFMQFAGETRPRKRFSVEIRLDAAELRSSLCHLKNDFLKVQSGPKKSRWIGYALFSWMELLIAEEKKKVLHLLPFDEFFLLPFKKRRKVPIFEAYNWKLCNMLWVLLKRCFRPLFFRNYYDLFS